jgi:hypothetical protein
MISLNERAAMILFVHGFSILLQVRFVAVFYVPDTTREIWLDLSKWFSQSNAPQIFQLNQSVSFLKQENMFVSAYFTKAQVTMERA